MEEKKICIMGTAPSSMNIAPFGNPEWTIWACSPGTYHLPRIDKFFELHRYEPGQEWFSEGYCEFLKKFPGEVVMTNKVAEIQGCTLLDYEKLIGKYGPYFFTSSIAWMMAQAIEEGATKIALYGVDMGAASEYKDQRMGCQYFALIAKAKGIEVGVPPESDLLRPAPLYGLCEQSHYWIKQTSRSRELAARANEAQRIIDEKTRELHFISGALDDQDWNVQTWGGNVDTLGQRFVEPPEVPVLVEGMNPRMEIKNSSLSQVENIDDLLRPSIIKAKECPKAAFD